jgi:CHAT domain/NACHT domain
MRIQEYLDFELRLERGNGQAYAVSVLRSPAGEASGTMDLPLNFAALQTHLSAVADARSANGARSLTGTRRMDLEDETESDPLQHAREIGDSLFKALLTGDILTCYRTSLHQAREEGKGLRLRLRVQAPDLAALPWEYLMDVGFRPLTLSSQTPLVRHIEVPVAAGRLRLKPPIRVLGMVGSHECLDVETEKTLMGQALEHLRSNGTMSLEWVQGHTWRDLQAALRTGEYHVFHFIGHGAFDETCGVGKLSLQGENGGHYLLDAEDLARMITDHESIRLVVLNSCEGARASQSNLFSSTGAILARSGVPGVVSMQYEISDKAALEFSRTFYDSMASGMPVEFAVSEARSSIQMTMKDTLEWATPVLHLRAGDGLLFEVDVNGALGLTSQPAVPIAPAPVRTAPGAVGDRSPLSILATKVKRYWIESVLAKKLEQSAHMDLGLDLMSSAVNSPFGSGNSGILESGTGTENLGNRSIADVLPDYGSLLVLGDPGSGKTVALLEVAQDLLRKQEEEPNLPVPVVFNLSSWASKKSSLAEWMAGELTAKYQIPKVKGAEWLSGGLLFPLLDGLDEVAADARPACVEAINAWLLDAFSGAVVCCRFKEYNELPNRLNLNSAVRIQPFTREQVLTFVQEAGTPLAALRTLLERDSGLLLDARTPLMLTLMVCAFRGAQETDFVAEQNLASRRRQVMGAFVNREMLRARQGGSLV